MTYPTDLALTRRPIAAKRIAPSASDSSARLLKFADTLRAPQPDALGPAPASVVRSATRPQPAAAKSVTPRLAGTTRARRQMGRRAALASMGAGMALASGCAWTLYPERRGQSPQGRVDVVPLVVDILWFLPGLIPGAIFLAVDFASGAIYTSAAAKRSDGRYARKSAPKQLDVHPESKMLVRRRGSKRRADEVEIELVAHQAGRQKLYLPHPGPEGVQPVESTIVAPTEGARSELILRVGGKEAHRIDLVGRA